MNPAPLTGQQPGYFALLPFVVSTVFLLLGQVVSHGVGKRLQRAVEDDQARAESESGEAYLRYTPTRLRPGPLRQRFEWGSDASQLAGTVLSPLVAVLILLPADYPTTAWLPFLFAAIAAMTTALVIYVYSMDLGHYLNLAVVAGPLTLPFAVWLGVLINLMGGILAWTITRIQ